MVHKANPFVRIDEQGWFAHFHIRYKGWLYKPSSWLLERLRKCSYIEVVSTFGIDNGTTVRELRRSEQDRPQS